MTFKNIFPAKFLSRNIFFNLDYFLCCNFYSHDPVCFTRKIKNTTINVRVSTNSHDFLFFFFVFILSFFRFHVSELLSNDVFLEVLQNYVMFRSLCKMTCTVFIYWFIYLSCLFFFSPSFYLFVIIKGHFRGPLSSLLNLILLMIWFSLVWFYGISAIVGYLKLNSFYIDIIIIIMSCH